MLGREDLMIKKEKKKHTYYKNNSDTKHLITHINPRVTETSA